MLSIYSEIDGPEFLLLGSCPLVRHTLAPRNMCRSSIIYVSHKIEIIQIIHQQEHGYINYKYNNVLEDSRESHNNCRERHEWIPNEFLARKGRTKNDINFEPIYTKCWIQGYLLYVCLCCTMMKKCKEYLLWMLGQWLIIGEGEDSAWKEAQEHFWECW